MKTIEEKAKAYDNLIERLKDFQFEYRFSPFSDVISDKFPELAESEDARIRKIIKQSLKYYFEGKLSSGTNDVDYAMCLSWLEKQGERETLCDKCKKAQPSHSCQDITALGRCALEKQGEQKPAETVKWSPQEESCICQLESLVKEQWGHAERVHNSVNIKKMSELMFFLKTLNPNKKPQRIISAEAKEAMYDKTAWSEEDETNFRRTEYAVMKFFGGDCSLVGWLRKSIKERYTWKPSNEQMIALSDVNITGCISYAGQGQELINLYQDLKKLREE